ncbi:transcriptional regulator domain-containing protein [Roseibium aggregatum]|uniref:transcriptional regulator domain-containing protein n=1 Tax=Roseibium aggregatum TaxID=187304 RepID=UPI003AF38E80
MSRVGEDILFECWQNRAHYQCLLTLDRADWAWEFLRRHPDCPRILADPASRKLLRSAPPLSLVTQKTAPNQALAWGVRFCR